MASLRHSSSKLLKISEHFSCKCRSFSVYKNKTHFSKLYTTSGVLVGVSAFYYINKLRNSHTVHAYKPRKSINERPINDEKPLKPLQDQPKYNMEEHLLKKLGQKSPEKENMTKHL